MKTSLKPSKRRWDDFDELEQCVVDVLVTLFQSSVTYSDAFMVCDGPCCRHPHKTIRQKRRYETRQQTTQEKGGHVSKLPDDAKRILNLWLYTHTRHPYPSTAEKHCIMRQTGLTIVQINNWFSNARRRKLKRPSSSSSYYRCTRGASHGTSQNHT